MAKKWMPEEEQYLLDHQESLSTREMAAKFGVTQKAVSDKLRRLRRRSVPSPAVKTEGEPTAARSSPRPSRRASIRPTAPTDHSVAVQREVTLTGAVPGLEAKGERYLRKNLHDLLDREIADLFDWAEEDVPKKLERLVDVHRKNGVGSGVSTADAWLNPEPVTLATCARCDVQYHSKFITGFTDCRPCRRANIQLWLENDLPVRALHR
jgi:predicted ArsR family transcriptional regulator